MCWQCDNPDGDYDAHMIELIEVHGWAVSGVESSATNPGWLHTVGLPYRFGHPELVIAGASDESGRVLNGIGAYIRDSGRRIEAGQTMALGDRVYGFGAVSRQRRRAGVIQASIDVHRRLGVTGVKALDVVRMEECEFCDHHFEQALRDLISKDP